MQRHTRVWLLSLILLSALLVPAIVSAQEALPSDNEVNAVAKNLYCPVCPNTPLDVCETKACQDWREQIRMQLAQGWTEQEILDYFVAQYGERVLAEPQRSGFTSLVWLLPVIAIGLGALAVWQILRRWQQRFAIVDPGRSQLPETLDPRIRAQIEHELRMLDK